MKVAERSLNLLGTIVMLVFSVPVFVGYLLVLWLSNFKAFKQVQDNPRARKAMANHPGVQFMRWGLVIIWAALMIFANI